MNDLATQLIEEFFDRIHAYVRLRVAEQDCEDLVSEIFLRAIERSEQVRGETGAWLFAIARSRIVDYYRKKKESAMPVDLTERDGAPPTPTTPPTLEPLKRLERAEFNEQLRRQINGLSELERDVITLKFTDGLNNIEIAEMLKITPNHLGVVLHRALSQLRGAMLKEMSS